MAVAPTRRLGEPVAAIADDAASPELAADVRAVASDEAAVLATIAGTRTEEGHLELLTSGLLDAVIEHATDGFGALRQTGSVLVVRSSTAAHRLLNNAVSFIAHRSIPELEVGEHWDGVAGPVARAAARTVRASPGVHRLVLNADNVPSDDLALALGDLAASPWLGSLRLTGASINTDCAAAPATAVGLQGGLQSLAMKDCHMDLGGFPRLSMAAGGSEVLERLELTTCDLGPRGEEALGAMLADTGSLATLKIAMCNLSDGGMACLASGLRHNASLTELALADATDGVVGAAALSEVLTVNATLQALEIDTFGDAAAAVTGLSERLARWRGLRTLKLDCAAQGGEAALALGAALRQNTSLTTVFLSEWDGSAEAAGLVAEALGSPGGRLAELSMGLVSAVPACADAIMAAGAGFRAGSTLRLELSGEVDEAVCRIAAGLPRCTNLRGLFVQAWGGSRTAASALSEALVGAPWLTALGMRGMDFADGGAASFAAGIRACTGLTTLSVGSFGLDDPAWESARAAVESLPAVESLTLGSIGFKESAAWLADCLPSWGHSLTELDLSCGSHGSKGVQELAPGLGGCSGLRKLDLSFMDVGDAGMVALAHALRGCPALTELRCEDCGVGSEGLGALLATAEALPDLVRLQLDGNLDGVRADDLEALAGCRRRDTARRRRLWVLRRRLVAWRRCAAP